MLPVCPSKFDVHEVAETINNNGLGFMHRVTHIIDGVEGWNCFGLGSRIWGRK